MEFASFLSAVDGPVGVSPKLATLKKGIADNRSIHASDSSKTWVQSEIQILEYRLEVVSSWPESERKRVTMRAIYSQLERHADAMAAKAAGGSAA